MLVIKRNQDLIPSIFNELFDWNGWNDTNKSHTPKMNISESDADYRLDLCVPGLVKDDLSLSIDPNGYLTVEMNKSDSNLSSDDNRSFLRREFQSLQFKESLALPDDVKREEISAKVLNGILTITLPKVTEADKKSLSQTIAIA